MIDAPTHTRKMWRSHFDGADSTIAAKILWSSLFDTSNVNQVLMSIYMTISNYPCQKYGTFSF
jgi:hypothetical protein